MRTIFVNPPHGRYDMGRFGLPALHPTLPLGLGQEMTPLQRETAFNIVSEILGAVGIDEKDLVSVIDALPIADQGPYKAKLDQCKKLGLQSGPGAKCLYDLFQELKDVVEGKKPLATTPPGTPPVVRPPESGFPLLPVALGLLAAGGLIYFLATRGG